METLSAINLFSDASCRIARILLAMLTMRGDQRFFRLSIHYLLRGERSRPVPKAGEQMTKGAIVNQVGSTRIGGYAGGLIGIAGCLQWARVMGNR